MPRSRPSRTILLVRHPETDWNRAGLYQGRTSRPLTAAGSASMAATAACLRPYRPGLVVCSPARHARTLAQTVLVGLGIAGDLDIDEDWREIDHGTWEGLSHEEIIERYGRAAEARFDDPLHFDGHGGETLADVELRVARAWERVLGLDHPGIVVVTHATPIRLVLHRCLGFPLSNLWRVGVDNGAVTRIDVSGGWPTVSFVNRCPDR